MSKLLLIFHSGKKPKLLEMLYGSFEERDKAIAILRQEACEYCNAKGSMMGLCRDDVLDLFQDAMLAFLESLSEKKIKKNPSGYLKRIIKNKSINKLNKKKELKMRMQEQIEPSTSDDDKRKEVLELTELAISKIHKVMDDINPLYKTLLYHRYILGLSLKQIAVEQQSSPEVVKTQLERARKAVREKLRN
jgi:RNA polymerase sigma factor (sigma-70 family)